MPDPALRFETTLSSGHRVSLLKADITEQATEAIVNAANFGLDHGGGVAGAIVRKGGRSIQEESDRIGKVAIGSAAVTGAGSLPSKWVIHAVGPVWRGNTPERNDELLSSATIAALEIARAKGLHSIAFPAVSSGIFGFPKDRCAQVMTSALMAWANTHAEDSPRDLRFTIVDEETVAIFESHLIERFSSGEDQGTKP